MSNAKPLRPVMSRQNDDTVAPLHYGDRIVIEHLGGARQEVVFEGVYGENCDQPIVRWGLAGQYYVQFQTGQLKPKKASVWRVIPEHMARIRATSVRDLSDRHARIKAERYK